MITGVWVPLVTPFKNGEFDLECFKRLIQHYVTKRVDGLVLLGTTGEAPTLDDREVNAIVADAVSVVQGRLPVFVGVGGNDTRKVTKNVAHISGLGVDGILSVCPYYNRPTQDGMKQHFAAIASATDLPVIIYNIPYRTGVNLSNDAVLELAEISNIIGIKDSSGDIDQSLDLLARRPADFSVLTGEDHMFFTMLCNGGQGGILASSHVATELFLEVARLVTKNDHQAAIAQWRRLQTIVSMLFEEANPMPIKYCLWRQGLLETPECRLPMSAISKQLAGKLDLMLTEL